MSARLDNPLIFALFGVCVLGLGSWVMIQEGETYFNNGSTSIARVGQAIDSQHFAGFSKLTQDASLKDCAATLASINSLAMRYQSQQFRDELAPHCRKVADAVVASSPSHSFAWLVGAMAAAQQHDWPAFNAQLLRSQLTGRSEQWIAQPRVQLAENNYEHTDDAAKAGNERDLSMLVGSAEGIRTIGKRYFNEPEFRERITAIVEKMPQEVQERFLRVIKTEISNHAERQNS